MTRKRFIKLIMSCGVQRNDAAALASMVSVYGSYEQLLASVVSYLAAVVKAVANQVSAAFSKKADAGEVVEWPQG